MRIRYLTNHASPKKERIQSVCVGEGPQGPGFCLPCGTSVQVEEGLPGRSPVERRDGPWLGRPCTIYLYFFSETLYPLSLPKFGKVAVKKYEASSKQLHRQSSTYCIKLGLFWSFNTRSLASTLLKMGTILKPHWEHSPHELL